MRTRPEGRRKEITMGSGWRFHVRGVGGLGAVLGLGLAVLVAPPPILGTERSAPMQGDNVSWNAGGGGDEASTETEGVVGGTTVHGSLKSDDEADDGDEDRDGFDPRKNIVAIHDSSSKQYKEKCGECHSEIHSRESLDPSIPAAHPGMFPFAAGKAGDDKQCRWCHRTVDLTLAQQSSDKSKGNLRRHVDVTLCTLCHGPYRDGPGKQFYQSGLSPTDPDGFVVYDVVCAGCHRELENSQVKGKNAHSIQKAIDNDKGGMGVLTVLSTQEIDALAAVLAEAGGGD